ncbi:hypothetical protein [Azohydromonas aeria]|uniref:hypothetical protein n=1 Tax=Azohydromonas aeria TaxID=2590212 RepID=UPI0012FCF562|nr:hypothetical protein [Azohydromonas aeria]
MKHLPLPAVRKPALIARPHAAFGLLLAAVALALAVWMLLPPAQAFALLAEGAPIELGTAALYFLLVPAVWAARQPRDETRVLVLLSVAFLVFGARELDLHKAWTGMSVLKVSFYLHGAPLHQKLVAAPLALGAVATLGYLLLRFWRPVLRRAVRRDPVALTIACFCFTMAVSKVFDRMVNIAIDDFGMSVPVTVDVLVSALEEIMELSLPLMALLGLAQHRLQPGAGPSFR